MPQDGAIRALVGGFDFNKNKFNHVTQAWRQPGSSFKPFIYSASLDKGLGPATIINDAPLYFPPTHAGRRRRGSRRTTTSPTVRCRCASRLQKSKNLVSIRILSYIGTKYAQDFVTQNFGFDVDKTPPYLPLALGAGPRHAVAVGGAYSVFANGGYRDQSVSDRRGDRCARHRDFARRSADGRAATRRKRSSRATRTS